MPLHQNRIPQRADSITVLKSLWTTAWAGVLLWPTLVLCTPPFWIHPQMPLNTNPAQQHAPSSEELRLTAVEQALANYVAREIKMQKTLSLLTDGFQLLPELVQTHIPLCTSLKVPSMDITPIWSTPTRQPLSLALPDEFHGDQTEGQSFLTSCQTYIRLCPDSFSDQIKIIWALSYMKSSRAGKWAATVFEWEEDNEGYLRFLDWDRFWAEFQKNFCPLHSNTVAINALESISYFQGNHSIDDYLDEFTDLITDARYMDLKIIIVKFQRGLNPQIQDAIATLAYRRPSNTSPGTKRLELLTKTALPMKLLNLPISHSYPSPPAMIYLS